MEESCPQTHLKSQTFAWPGNASLALDLWAVQSNHSGVYTCQASSSQCLTPDGWVFNGTASVQVDVLPTTHYQVQMAVILSTCLLLMAILIGLYAWNKPRGRRNRTQYQVMLAATHINSTPNKVQLCFHFDLTLVFLISAFSGFPAVNSTRY